MMMENAQAMSDAAEKEVKAADECLKNAEKRWQVIDVDMDTDVTLSRNNKRRKVSLSPQAADNTNTNNSGNTAGQPNSARNNKVSTGVATGATSSSSSNVIYEKIIVEGCGMSEINGIYSLIRIYHHGAPLYYKIEKGKVKHKIYRLDNVWFIADTKKALYECRNPLVGAPPEDGWISAKNGEQNTAPRCRAQVAKRAVLSKKNTDALLFEIKRLVSLWADEGQMDGKRIFYWYIMTNNMMAEVAYRVPTTMEELAKCDLPQHVVDEYGERLIKSIKAFLEQTNVSFHDA